MRKTAYLLVLLSLASVSATLLAKNQSSGAADSPHAIEVVGKTFEFTPNEIHFKVGDRVQIKLRSADGAHGLKLNIYAEGASEDGNPGLVFDHPRTTPRWKKTRTA